MGNAKTKRINLKLYFYHTLLTHNSTCIYINSIFSILGYLQISIYIENNRRKTNKLMRKGFSCSFCLIKRRKRKIVPLTEFIYLPSSRCSTASKHSSSYLSFTPALNFNCCWQFLEWELKFFVF